MNRDGDGRSVPPRTWHHGECARWPRRPLLPVRSAHPIRDAAPPLKGELRRPASGGSAMEPQGAREAQELEIAGLLGDELRDLRNRPWWPSGSSGRATTRQNLQEFLMPLGIGSSPRPCGRAARRTRQRRRRINSVTGSRLGSNAHPGRLRASLRRAINTLPSNPGVHRSKFSIKEFS